MRFGVTLPHFGDFFHPRVLAGLARDAEQAGWDGFFIWDHVILWPTPMVDPWVALAAAALATERIRIGPLVTPLPRRRPTKLARETLSLDHLSGGRLVLGVGIGVGPWEWDYLGEETDLRTRGAMLDEGLDLLTRLWSGEPVMHRGRFYSFWGDGGPGDPAPRPTPFLPAPVQSPRIPVWVAGTWPNKPPFRRAAGWDGVVPLVAGKEFHESMTPGEAAAIFAYVRDHGDVGPDYAFAVGGHTSEESDAADAETVGPFAGVGANWWLEDISPWKYGWRWEGPWPVERMTARIRRGPPRL